MRKMLIALLLLTTIVHLGFAQQVDETTARTIGLAFLSGNSEASGLRNTDLKLVYTAGSKAAINSASPDPGGTYFYVFNAGNQDGFVIVSGDESVLPVLAYADEGSFDQRNIPQNVAKWLEGYKKEIRYVLDNKLKPSTGIREEWKNLKEGRSGNTSQRTKAVNPLIKTAWNQSPFYNALCPMDNTANSRAVTGCVATAMAQVLKYWNYPATGTGFHSFNHPKYGTLSANFGSTTYQWASMPNGISSTNNAIATLMYQCGVSVDMNYGADVSGAYVISSMSPVTHCTEYALKTYFGYKSTLQGLKRENYTEAQWITLMKSELDAGRPVIYAGFGGGGGHCFINDGYENNNFFHFNWGWGGAYDGYFSINGLNPEGTGTGGGTGGYNSGHQAIIGIEPASQGTQTFNLDLTADVTASAPSVGYGNAFSVSCNITNKGTVTFNGDYCAALFDASGTFVDYVQLKSGMSLPASNTYTNNLVFSNSGSFTYLPGTYTVYMFYRPAGQDWKQITATSSLVDDNTTINIVNANDIELNASITPTPVTWKRGQAASVTLNVVNSGANTFTGTYGVGLFKLDGTLAQTIALKTESSGLPSGYTYVSPFLTFSTAAVTVEPGTYLLALQHNPNNTGWKLTGSTNFQNPIKVIVEEPPLQPDQYEANNTQQQAKTLTVTFNGTTATTTTTGTNLHTGSDYDYFRVNLPAGYEYSIRPRLHDSQNSGNGNTYTVDALFSYSLNGTTWSEVYDDTMTKDIELKDGGTVYFHIAPYFSGETGTYLLDISLSRKIIVGIEETVSKAPDALEVYPNPASQSVTIDMKAFKGAVRQIVIATTQGQEITSIPDPGNSTIEVPLSGMNEGLYLLHFKTDIGHITKKLLVKP